MKRIILFLVTNLAVVFILSIVARVTGLDRWVALHGGSYQGLLVMAALFGFGGALISLAMSKWMAKRAMGVQVIERPANANEEWLVSTVRSLASQAGIGMPEVGVFDSPQPNAFATGARRDAALVAVSTGLMQSMNRSEVEAVLGHEITHVANGDMVTLTLIQGVVNTFVIFLSRIIGGIVDRALSRDGEGRGGIGYFVTVMVTQMVLGIVGQHDRHVVFAAARISGRCRRRAPGGPQQHDRRARAAARWPMNRACQSSWPPLALAAAQAPAWSGCS